MYSQLLLPTRCILSRWVSSLGCPLRKGPLYMRIEPVFKTDRHNCYNSIIHGFIMFMGIPGTWCDIRGSICVPPMHVYMYLRHVRHVSYLAD